MMPVKRVAVAESAIERKLLNGPLRARPTNRIDGSSTSRRKGDVISRECVSILLSWNDYCGGQVFFVVASIVVQPRWYRGIIRP